jgi:uncharacterized protein (DUF427 family)
MSHRVRRDPGPDHPISVTSTGHLVTVTAHGQLLAASEHALTLREAGYAPVYYFPPADLNWDILRESLTASYCPHKGDASYVDAVLDEVNATEPTVIPDVGWTYREPYAPVAAIAGHLAFYPDRVEITEHQPAGKRDRTDRSKEDTDAHQRS